MEQSFVPCCGTFKLGHHRIYYRLKLILYRARKVVLDVLDSVAAPEIARNPAELNPVFATYRKRPAW